MRVLLTSTSYPSDAKDWRGRFIADMASALGKTSGIDLDVWAPPGVLPTEVGSAVTEADAAWLQALLKQGGIAQLLRKRGPFALGWTWGLIARLRAVYRDSTADVLHINWLQNALPLAVTRKPALITVLGSDFSLLKLPGMVSMLRYAFRGRRVILAPNAGWMVSKLERYFGDIAEIQPIPFGIDAAWFDVERRLNPVGPFDWLAVTRLTSGKLGALFEWGEPVFGGKHVLHLFGPRQDAKIAIPDWVRYHGPTYPTALRDEWFPRATGLITLSRHDEGRPQVMLEAMAAGLPIVASMLPAHLDMIQHGKTGMLVDSPQALRGTLDGLSDVAANESMATAARAWARADVGTWADCASRYAAAYQKLLS